MCVRLRGCVHVFKVRGVGLQHLKREFSINGTPEAKTIQCLRATAVRVSWCAPMRRKKRTMLGMVMKKRKC